MSDLEGSLSGEEEIEESLNPLHFEDSDDDAPEDISLSSSKEAALSQVNSYLKHIQDNKTQLKVKRKNQQQRNLAQKRKVVSVSSQKLDPSLLESISSVVLPEKTDDLSDVKKSKKQHMTFEDDSDLEETDFIPLNRNEGIQPVCIESVGREPIVQQKAANFKRNQMFGSKVRRDTNSTDFLSRMAKRRVLSAQPK